MGPPRRALLGSALAAACALARGQADEEAGRLSMYWLTEPNTFCDPAHGAETLENADVPLGGLSLVTCKEKCENTEGCEAVAVCNDTEEEGFDCWRLTDVHPDSCLTGAESRGCSVHLIFEVGKKGGKEWWTREHPHTNATDPAGADPDGALPSNDDDPGEDVPSTFPEWVLPDTMDNLQPYGKCEEKNCQLNVERGVHQSIDFTEWPLFQGKDHLHIDIVKGPASGQLLTSKGELFISSVDTASDPWNEYVYVPFLRHLDEDPGTAWSPVSGEDIGMEHDDPWKARKAFDSITFDAQWRREDGSVMDGIQGGKIIINLLDTPPRSPLVVYRCINGEDTNVTLRPSDANVKDGGSLEHEIAELWVRPPALMTPPSTGSIHRITGSTPQPIESAVNLGSHDEDWKVLYKVDPDLKQKIEQQIRNKDYLGRVDVGSPYRVAIGQELGQFQYWGKDVDGETGSAGIVKLVYDMNRPPTAYNFSYSFHVLAEEYHLIELMANDPNGDKLSFYVTGVPSMGRVFRRTAEGEKEAQPLGAYAEKSTAVDGWYVGRGHTRVVLVYEPAPVEEYNNTLERDMITFKVHDEHGGWSGVGAVTVRVGMNRAPVCGDRSYDDIFPDQEPTNVNLNYVEPDGDHITKLLLVWANNTLGDLVWRRQATRVEKASSDAAQYIDQVNSEVLVLRPGDAFSDTEGVLQYVLRNTTRDDGLTGRDAFYFRAEDEYGEKCHETLDASGALTSQIGRVFFTVRGHERPVNREENSEGIGGVRSERVVIGRWHLLPLWGKINTTIADPEVASIEDWPQHGELYLLNSKAVWDPSIHYSSYCLRYDCEDYMGDALGVSTSSEVPKVALKPAHAGLPTPKADFWVLYRTVNEPACPSRPCLAEVGKRDSFGFRLLPGDGGEDAASTKKEEINLYIASRDMRQVVITYETEHRVVHRGQDPEETGVTPEQLIVCPLSDEPDTSKLQVRILDDEEDLRLHKQARDYHLFQFSMNGYEPIKGHTLDGEEGESVRHGIRGLWVHVNNTVIVVPKADATKHTFKFRAAIWKRQPPDPDAKPGPAVWLEEEVIQVVVRRLNTPPVPRKDDTLYKAQLGMRTPIDLAGIDRDMDLLNFIITRLPESGHLQLDVRKVRKSRVGRMITLRKGSVVPAPADASINERGKVTVYYAPKRTVGASFPINDSFAFQIDDGSGILSVEQDVRIIITGSALRKFNPKYTMAIGLALAVIVLFMVVAFVVRLCRRYLPCCRGADSKGRHQRLPNAPDDALP
eukprot:TRINITY_DN927_c0_g1_i1.p1 TRINITY_DN927_c0_g1~~TRINITY_DN927_c0_g1_i1.p1  ORF type:complete len:1297 (+),score=441.02 TRINITY_DN927_c0_g1_i1:104-3892(+)